jgi:hypothetical protein
LCTREVTYLKKWKSFVPTGDLPGFIISVDEVDRRTGLDFNNLLDDAVEDDIEDDVEAIWHLIIVRTLFK